MGSAPKAVVSAEAILKSKTGRSLAAPDVPVTADNVAAYLPTEETLVRAKQQLEQLGFTVSGAGPTLTVVGEPERFERLLRVRLGFRKHPQTGQAMVECQGEVMIPEALQGLVETIVFPEPPEFFP
ncbi:MAG: hypothetical protein L0387_41660 [Acidobacteria bacterium]|nr:hypothetical protein [Acidobacteriota bacterium]